MTTERATYAQRRGLILAWNAGDIRAMAATLYIEHRNGIQQMETTAARNAQLGAPNDSHRPMEERRREKIARYNAELERRELADLAERAAQAAPDAREPQPCSRPRLRRVPRHRRRLRSIQTAARDQQQTGETRRVP